MKLLSTLVLATVASVLPAQKVPGYNIEFAQGTIVSVMDWGGKPVLVVATSSNIERLLRLHWPLPTPPKETEVELCPVGIAVLDTRPCAPGGKPYFGTLSDPCGYGSGGPGVTLDSYGYGYASFAPNWLTGYISYRRPCPQTQLDFGITYEYIIPEKFVYSLSPCDPLPNKEPYSPPVGPRAVAFEVRLK